LTFLCFYTNIGSKINMKNIMTSSNTAKKLSHVELTDNEKKFFIAALKEKRNIHHGEITFIIQDKKIVQLNKLEKNRYE